MATPTINGDQIKFGPGKLYMAPDGTITEAYTQTSFDVVSSAFPLGTSAGEVPGDAAWVALGATKEGSMFNVSLDVAEAEVAESLAPVKYITTKRAAKASFELAQINMDNLEFALNGGTWAGTPGPISAAMYTPPLIGDEQRANFLWVGQDNDEILIGYRVLQVGELSIARKKGAEYATLTMELQFELPDPDISVHPFAYIVCGADFA